MLGENMGDVFTFIDLLSLAIWIKDIFIPKAVKAVFGSWGNK